MPEIKNKKILFIINPNSGKRNVSKILYELRAFESDVAVVITNSTKDLKKEFETNIDKYNVFIVVGGDGTVNEAAKYLHGRSDKILGIYPAGSGNGFARELGFKKKLKSLVEDAKKEETIQVDILSVNNRLCINVAGLGFDSFVAHRFHKSKGRGLKNYIWSTLKSAITFKPFEAKITTGEKEIRGKFQMISIANTRQFGNNAIISPQSKPNDGIFELALVKPFPFYLYPSFVVKMFRGTLKESKYISYLKAKKTVEIASGFKMYHIDGEPKVFGKSLKIKMREDKIQILKTSFSHFM